MNDFVRTPLEPYDVAKIWEDFPILTERPYGRPLVYLDNAASAQKPKAVIDRLLHAYEHEYANVHRGLHYLANAATEAYEAARESVRRFLNAASTDEIVFTRAARLSTTPTTSSTSPISRTLTARNFSPPRSRMATLLGRDPIAWSAHWPNWASIRMSVGRQRTHGNGF